MDACSKCESQERRWQTLPLSRGLVELSRCGSCTAEMERVHWTVAVSYTHLTLPTNREV